MQRWLMASAVILGATIVGCQAGSKSHVCHCEDKEVTHKEQGGNDYAEKEDGKREEMISADKVPAVVMTGFQKEFSGVTIEKIKKETYADGTVHYEFEYKDKDGKEREVELNSDGEVLEDH